VCWHLAIASSNLDKYVASQRGISFAAMKNNTCVLFKLQIDLASKRGNLFAEVNNNTCV
jgi:hypothetical protein